MDQGGGGGETYNGEQRPWSDLCTDILLRILTFLPFMDHLSFRAVCTLWRAAARQAQPEHQPQDQHPWLIFNSEEAHKKRILDPRTRKLYSIEWPGNMGGARCIASRHGWLLFHSPPDSRIFFFNPFSRATIDLPYIESISPASFDGHPTQDDCVVIGIFRCLPREVMICYIGRGDAYWTLGRCKTFWSWGPFTHAVSCNHLFCFMDAQGKLFVFNFLKFSAMECRGPPLNFGSFRVAYMVVTPHWRVFAAFVDVDRGHVCVFVMRDGMWEWLLRDLEGEVFYLGRTASLAFDGTVDAGNLIYFDTLVEDGSTCPVLSVGRHAPLTDFMGFENDTVCKDAVWIEPRWIEPSPRYDWLLTKYRFGDEEDEAEELEVDRDAGEEDDNDSVEGE